MRYRSLCVFTALLFSVAVPAAEEPKWLQEARAREAKPGPMTSIKSKNGFFSAKVPARQEGEMNEDDASVLVEMNIGTDAPVSCEVIKGGFDPAALLRTVADSTLPELAQHFGKLEARAVERQDAGVVGTSPFMALDWIYRVSDGQQLQLGALKQFVAMKGGHGIYCAHADLGYSKTFERIVTAFVETIEFSEADPLPEYFEVHTAEIGDTKVGIVVVSRETDEDGDHRLTNSSSLLVPVAADTLASQDTYHLQWASGKDLSLLNSTHVTSSNGEVETNLSLQWTDDAWQVEGQFNGKEIKETIDSDESPATWMAQARARRDLLGSSDASGKSLSDKVWLDVAPTTFVDSKFTVLSAVDKQHVSAVENAAGISIDVVLEKASGLPVSMVMNMGPQSIKVKRVLKIGEL